MLKILGRANSFNVRKILWACAELSIPFEREDYGRGFRATRTPEFLALNPTAQVPVVIDNGRVLRESNTVIRYLASRERAGWIYPEDLYRRAVVEQWMDWVAYDVTHALRGAFLGGQLGEAPWNNPWFVQQGRHDLIDCMRLVEAELSVRGPFITGAEFTLADIPMGLVVNRWFSLKELDRPDLPSVAAYYEKLTERPGFVAHGRNGLP